MLKLLSLDVWDTLLRRRCAANAIKLQTCLYLLIRHRQQLAPAFNSHWKLFYERQRHEDGLAMAAHSAGHDDEYTINELFTAWLGTVVTDAEGIPALVDELVALELANEFAHSYPDPDIAALIEAYPAQQRAFISDFYMDAPTIHRLLTEKGLGHYFAQGFCSCDHLRNKNSGRLFAHVHQTLGVAPSSHLHIGDHPHADFANARRAGMQSVLFRPARETARKQIHERLIQKRGNLLRHLDTLTARSLAKARASRPQEDGLNPYEEIGRQAAPLLLACCLRIAQTAIEREVKSIRFAHDSQLLRLAYSRLFPNKRFAGIPLPDCEQADPQEVSPAAENTLLVTLTLPDTPPATLNPVACYASLDAARGSAWHQIFATPSGSDTLPGSPNESLRRGMLFALDTWQEFADCYALTADELDEVAGRIAARSPLSLLPPDAMQAGDPGDLFGQNGYFADAELPTLGNFISVPCSSEVRAKLHSFLAEIDQAPHTNPLRKMGPIRRSAFTVLLNLVRKVRRDTQ